MKKPDRYSSIRKRKTHVSSDPRNINVFYENLISPHALLLTIAGYFALLNKDNLITHITQVSKGVVSSKIHIALIILSFLVGIRLIHSLILAKRDYSKIRSNFFDILIFTAILLFTTGAIIQLADTAHHIILFIYGVCAVIGAFNFFTLFSKRIPDTDLYDLPIEKRIQFVNFVVFSLLAILTMYSGFMLFQKTTEYNYLFGCFLGCYALLLVNILHSEQLSSGPKFLIQNRLDLPSNRVIAFRKFFTNRNNISDEEILRFIYGYEQEVRHIKTKRARRSDVNRIIVEMTNSFGYVFAHVLTSDQKDNIKKFLHLLITSAGGLGRFGYMNFYFIVDHSCPNIFMS